MDSVANIERYIKGLEHKLQEQLVENDRLKKGMMKAKDKPVKIEIEYTEGGEEGSGEADVKQCSKCKRQFSRRDYMKKHETKCDGLGKQQCKICLKQFASRYGKYEHKKYVKCSPPKTC
jgi:hypothetical protein